jgi:flagellar biosynthesis protein FlhF
MKIKRYTAVSMRAALAQVRAEQGPDAVILSSRRGEDGIEVIAAVDYDEALFVEARQRSPAENLEPPISATPAAPQPSVAPSQTPAVQGQSPSRPQTPAVQGQSPSRPQTPAVQSQSPSRPQTPAVQSQSPSRPQTSAVTPRPPQPAPSSKLIPSSFRRLTVSAPPEDVLAQASMPARAARPGSSLGAMQRELQDLRQVIETGLAGMSWNDKRLREPLKARVLEELWAMDIAPDVAMALAALTPQRTNLDNPSLIPLALLVKHLPVVDPPAGVSGASGVSGGIIAVVGPTGAGKTTTIAKLAARWCMHHGSQDLALVSTDGYRIGAREQLMTYARILGVPMYAANSGMEIARALERLKSKKLVLIDTAGMGPRDVRLTEQLAALQLGAARARVMLALPAQGEGHALEEIVQAFARVAPAACILTKVDEAASLGAALSTALRHKLKIAYVCDGQRVPEDLHTAYQKRVWLVRAALNLKSAAPPRDKAHHAHTFDRARAHV